MPFDRLVQAVDAWAARSGRADEVFAQIGIDAETPTHIESSPLLDPSEFEARVAGSDVIVAHAGMGSILTALRHGKPILVMPRRGALQETRNDHQVATAERLGAMAKVAVAMDERGLADRLDRIDELAAADPIGPHASESLIRAIRGFIMDDGRSS